jgi:exodeoxyribonuclease VII large subunit
MSPPATTRLEPLHEPENSGRRAVAFKNESMLDALNPMAILQRGYSITRTLPGQSIVRNARQIKIDQNLEILLGRGN